MNEFTIGLNSVYVFIIYLYTAYYVAQILDNAFLKIFKQNENKSQMKLLIECSIQTAFTAIIAFICRKVLSKIPFPLISKDQININEISDQAGIIWSAFILIFEKSLVAKLGLLKKNMTSF